MTQPIPITDAAKARVQRALHPKRCEGICQSHSSSCAPGQCRKADAATQAAHAINVAAQIKKREAELAAPRAAHRGSLPPPGPLPDLDPAERVALARATAHHSSSGDDHHSAPYCPPGAPHVPSPTSMAVLGAAAIAAVLACIALGLWLGGLIRLG